MNYSTKTLFAQQKDGKKVVLCLATRRRLSSTLNFNRNLKEECIDQGTYRARGDRFIANFQSEVNNWHLPKLKNVYNIVYLQKWPNTVCNVRFFFTAKNENMLYIPENSSQLYLTVCQKFHTQLILHCLKYSSAELTCYVDDIMFRSLILCGLANIIHVSWKFRYLIFFKFCIQWIGRLFNWILKFSDFFSLPYFSIRIFTEVD